MDPNEIIASLSSTEPGYRREAVDAAVAQRKAVVPALLALLDDTLAAPKAHARPDYSAPLYAIALLAHVAEESAHDRLLALARLPDEILDDLLGDGVTETLPLALWRTHGGSLDGIKALLAESTANEYVRIAAAELLVYAVAEGILPREEVLGLLAAQLSDDETDDILNGGLVAAMLDLSPREYEERIRQLLDEGLVDPWSVDDDELDEALELGVEAALDTARDTFEARIPANVHGYLERFAWCDESEPEDEEFAPLSDDDYLRYAADYGFPGESPRKGPSQAAKDKRKKKRKAASKARKKNRKK